MGASRSSAGAGIRRRFDFWSRSPPTRGLGHAHKLISLSTRRRPGACGQPYFLVRGRHRRVDHGHGPQPGDRSGRGRDQCPPLVSRARTTVRCHPSPLSALSDTSTLSMTCGTTARPVGGGIHWIAPTSAWWTRNGEPEGGPSLGRTGLQVPVGAANGTCGTSNQPGWNGRARRIGISAVHVDLNGPQTGGASPGAGRPAGETTAPTSTIAGQGRLRRVNLTIYRTGSRFSQRRLRSRPRRVGTTAIAVTGPQRISRGRVGRFPRLGTSA